MHFGGLQRKPGWSQASCGLTSAPTASRPDGPVLSTQNCVERKRVKGTLLGKMGPLSGVSDFAGAIQEAGPGGHHSITCKQLTHELPSGGGGEHFIHRTSTPSTACLQL